MTKVFFGLVLTAFIAFGCHNHNHNHADDGIYIVNITVNKPTVNQIVAKNTVMPIDVSMTRDNQGTIHNVKVEIIDAAGANVTTLLDKHHHEAGTFNYTEGAYKPQTVGSFKLKITVTDDDKLQPNVKETAFTVN